MVLVIMKNLIVLLTQDHKKVKMLTDEEIVEMLSCIIEALDYDLWKDYFCDFTDDPHFAGAEIEEMVAIVKDHIEKSNK